MRSAGRGSPDARPPRLAIPTIRCAFSPSKSTPSGIGRTTMPERSTRSLASEVPCGIASPIPRQVVASSSRRSIASTYSGRAYPPATSSSPARRIASSFGSAGSPTRIFPGCRMAPSGAASLGADAVSSGCGAESAAAPRRPDWSQESADCADREPDTPQEGVVSASRAAGMSGDAVVSAGRNADVSEEGVAPADRASQTSEGNTASASRASDISESDSPQDTVPGPAAVGFALSSRANRASRPGSERKLSITINSAPFAAAAIRSASTD